MGIGVKLTNELHYPPPLTDGEVRLRSWRDDDVDCIRQASLDTRIPEGTTVPATYSPAEGLAFISRQHGRLSSGQGVSLAITREATDAAIGLIILQIRQLPGVAGIGYWLVPAARGEGLATQAVNLMTDWALSRYVRVEAWVEPHNTASRRTLEKAGFEREGLLRSYLLIGTRRADALVYSRLAPAPQ